MNLINIKGHLPLTYEAMKAAFEKLEEERTIYPGIRLVKSDVLKDSQVIIFSGDNVYYSPNITTGEVKAITIPEIKDQKIQAYFTPTFPKVDKYGFIEEETPQKPCKPEHKVGGKIPMLYDLHFDKKNCDCGRVRYVAEECGCSIKEYRLIKIPNE